MLDTMDYDLENRCSTVGVEQTASKSPRKPTAMDWFKAIGPKVNEVVKPFQCGAPWTAFASDLELRRLARLQARIERKQAALSELKADRRQIMVRCVRRMRRERGLSS
ncbi:MULTISPECIES: hypothetical protein [unclassified Sulfitobacter]|uniref:hypothetical protein n=1 Tax=unclassified Sulfitobacter TaxID=196795 RepID=UPI001ADD08F3|nr:MULTISPECIES: hypothetical protein [unclassified Sulfitobacter]MBO9430594.1 hypothetical protein [Sulfitobacter sp. R18_1]WPZ30734.1 hypothetical protein T8A63_06650 [Sulfitobacter sp. OXR-159]WPZ30835.1 hypothetical protein T8A63_07160 [Sulfitobacter sp. OXR-159]